MCNINLPLRERPAYAQQQHETCLRWVLVTLLKLVVAEAPDGQVAVEVVVNGTAHECADVVEAVAAVHGGIAHVGSGSSGS